MAAKEAADYALKGTVPDKSKDGYAIGTFAGGCFWGLELAYQRVPGVIDTSVCAVLCQTVAAFLGYPLGIYYNVYLFPKYTVHIGRVHSREG